MEHGGHKMFQTGRDDGRGRKRRWDGVTPALSHERAIISMDHSLGTRVTCGSKICIRATMRVTRFRPLPLVQAYLYRLLGLLFFLVCLCSIAEAEDNENYAEDSMKKARKVAKPWYLRNIQYGDMQLPFSPITLIVVFFSIYYLTSSWSGKKVYCEASHILLMDHTEESKKKLEDYKKKIGNDPALFAKYAKKYSACPSKSKGGNLGSFPRSVMAPPFDKVCFDPQTPLLTTVGPVHTSFGWHLIYIHKRQLSE